MTLVTLQAVADRARVSLATASRVVNGSSRRVANPELVERVVAAAAELKYVPNGHAQTLASRGGANPTVGVIAHDISDPYFSEIFGGALRAAMSRDVLVLLACTYRDPDREIAYVQTMHRQRAKAVILAGSGFADEDSTGRLSSAVSEYRAGGGRVAVISQQRFGANAVLPDNAGGGAKLAAAMLELGHKEFAIISGPRDLLTVRDRLRGVTKGLRRAGIRVSAERVVDGLFSRDGGYEAVKRLHAQGELASITCLVALSDVMALGVMAALRELRVAVPRDVSVAGFGDIPSLRDLSPALTTVHLSLEDMGAQAIDLVLGREVDEDAGPRSVSIEADVILRESTSVPRSRRVEA